MNKMAIIAGEIATGPGLGSSSVIINKIRQPLCSAAPAQLRALAPTNQPRAASQPPRRCRTAPSRTDLYYHCFQNTIVHYCPHMDFNTHSFQILLRIQAHPLMRGYGHCLEGYGFVV